MVETANLNSNQQQKFLEIYRIARYNTVRKLGVYDNQHKDGVTEKAI